MNGWVGSLMKDRWLYNSKIEKKKNEGLSFISNRQWRKEGTFCAYEFAWIETTPPAPKEQGMPVFAAKQAKGGNKQDFKCKIPVINLVIIIILNQNAEETQTQGRILPIIH